MTIEYATGPTVMMSLGTFQFGIATAAYQELGRTTEWRWPAQERFMQGQALQFVGPGGDTINLPGVIYPEYRGGFAQLDQMRASANNGKPLVLIDGVGNIMGRWVIERLEEKQSVFAAAGRARKMEFTLALRKFDELTPGLADAGSLLGALAGASGAASAIPTSVDGVAVFVKSATGAISSIAGSLAATVTRVQAVATDLGAAAGSVLSPINGALRTANNLAHSLNDSQRLLGMKPTKLSGLASLNKTVNAATSAVANCSQFGRTLASVSRDLQAAGTIPAGAMKAVQDAVVSVNRLTVAATSIQSQASKATDNVNA